MFNYSVVLLAIVLTLQLTMGQETKSNGKLIRLSGGKARAGSSYWFGTNAVTWDQAKVECEEAGLKLLVIENAGEQGRFEQYMDLNMALGNFNGWTGNAWIAGTDRRSNPSAYYWSLPLNVKQTMTYRHFYNNNAISGCASISNTDLLFGWWIGTPCTGLTMYFCED